MVIYTIKFRKAHWLNFKILTLSSDGDAVRHSLGQQVRVTVLYFKACIPFFNLSGDPLQLLLKLRNGMLGFSFSKQPLTIVTNEFLWEKQILPWELIMNNNRGWVIPYTSDVVARRKILFYERVPNSFPTLGGTDSTTTNYIRSITLPGQAPKGTQTTLAAVILGFSTPSGTNPQILTPAWIIRWRVRSQ